MMFAGTSWLRPRHSAAEMYQRKITLNNRINNLVPISSATKYNACENTITRIKTSTWSRFVANESRPPFSPILLTPFQLTRLKFNHCINQPANQGPRFALLELCIKHWLSCNAQTISNVNEWKSVCTWPLAIEWACVIYEHEDNERPIFSAFNGVVEPTAWLQQPRIGLSWIISGLQFLFFSFQLWITIKWIRMPIGVDPRLFHQAGCP